MYMYITILLSERSGNCCEQKALVDTGESSYIYIYIGTYI